MLQAEMPSKMSSSKVVFVYNKTDTGSWVYGDYILIFREWKRLIDRLTDKNTAR